MATLITISAERKKRKWNVRSQNYNGCPISKKKLLEPQILRLQGLKGRGKPCPISKKNGKKEEIGCPIPQKSRMSDLRQETQKNWNPRY